MKYFQVEYGRYAGRCKVTRLIRMDDISNFTYIEIRVHSDKVSYKIGNIKTIYHKPKKITKAKFDAAMKKALKIITNQ